MTHTRQWMICAPLLAALLLCAGCGNDTPSQAPEGGATGPSRPPSDKAGTDTTAAGTALGKEILVTFNALVDETHVLVKDKPAADEVLPKLTALIGRYEEKMTALASKHKALPDVHAQRAVRRHLSEHRPAAVQRKDELLGTLVFHYRGVDANPEMVAALTKKLVGVLNIAAK